MPRKGVKPQGTEEEKQQALALVAMGYSYRAIGRILGRDPHTIIRWARAAEDEVKQMHEELRREFAAAAWAKIFELLGTLTPEKIERLNARDAAWCMGVLFDKAMTAMSASKLAEVQQPQDAGQDKPQQPIYRIEISEKVAEKLMERRQQQLAQEKARGQVAG